MGLLLCSSLVLHSIRQYVQDDDAPNHHSQFCIVVAVCTIAVFIRVRKLDERTLGYRRPEMMINPNSFRMSMSRRRSSIRSLFHSSASLGLDQGSNESFQESEAEGTPTPSQRRKLSFRRKKCFDLAEEEEMDDAFLSGSLMDMAGHQSPSIFGRWREKREIYREDYTRSVEVAEQAMWCTYCRHMVIVF